MNTTRDVITPELLAPAHFTRNYTLRDGAQRQH